MLEMKAIKYRVLLSEVLPYETPLFFDNYGFYEKLVKNDITKADLNSIIKPLNFSIPFDYDIIRNGGMGKRRLSIIHPSFQLEIVDFYKKYDLLLLKYAMGSPFSLRHINRVAKLFYDTSHELIVDYDYSEVEMDEERENKVYVSYFSYKEIDRMYKFFKGMPLFRLEQKYRLMRKLDVAKCFYHIYTHSIAWAVEGKAAAKEHIRSRSLANDFDTLMQNCNYNETNGIVVGPEISRIFAEVIFRRIDFYVLEILKKQDIVLGREYELHRYVDDMLVFANDETVLDRIEKTIMEELEKFKLYVNPAKTETYKRPFCSSLYCGKQDLLEEFDLLQEKLKKKIRNPYKFSMVFFKKFRVVVRLYHLEYGDLNRMVLSLLAKMTKKESFCLEENNVLAVLDIAFYVFSLDMSTTASLHLCKIIFNIMKICGNEDKQHLILLKEKISKEMKRTIKLYLNLNPSNNMPIEIVNPILAIKAMGVNVCNRNIVFKVFRIKNHVGEFDCTNLNYFTICTLLMIVGDDPLFEDIKEKVKKTVIARYSATDKSSWKRYAENTMLLLDLMTCPFVDDEFKHQLINSSQIATKTHKICETRRKIEGKIKRWFFDWTMSPTALDYYLKKKEYRPTYE